MLLDQLTNLVIVLHCLQIFPFVVILLYLTDMVILRGLFWHPAPNSRRVCMTKHRLVFVVKENKRNWIKKASLRSFNEIFDIKPIAISRIDR